MKTERIVARADKKTLELIQEASNSSGIPVSEIIRKGALNEAVHILNMFGQKLKHVITNDRDDQEGEQSYEL